jgi:GDPmannose 4,6-dehydratase
MFGMTKPPQSEASPFYPRSPYGIAKVFAFDTTRNYREAYGIFAVNGILFNHESPRRGETFVTRKITRGIARIMAGLDQKIYLGNLDAKRDWGYAPEYVEAMWRMLQLKKPEDFVIGSGEAHSVREFVEIAFELVGITDWKKYVGIDQKYYRPTEVDYLEADISKAKRVMKWKPKTKLRDLVKIMLHHDLLYYGQNELAAKIPLPKSAVPEPTPGEQRA